LLNVQKDTVLRSNVYVMSYKPLHSNLLRLEAQVPLGT